MGLDIHAASKLVYLGPIPDGDARERLEDEAIRQDKSLYELYFPVYENDPPWEDHLAGMTPGLYGYAADSRIRDFRVGSYTDYGEWRDRLAEAAAEWSAGSDSATAPFEELIHFTDCDGRIGPRLAAVLAADFRRYAAAAEAFAPASGWADGERDGFLSIYREFTTAFEVAAADGALGFC